MGAIDRTAVLFRAIQKVLRTARYGARVAVNAAMVEAYWRIGEIIVRDELRGRTRAAYGDAALESLAARLTSEFGRGFDARNLRYMRQFYMAFELGSEIRNAPRSESPGLPPARSERVEKRSPAIRNALRSKLASPGRTTIRPELSWTHYRLLLAVDDAVARAWYMHEAAESRWSTRQLDRQISVLYYERLLGSRKPGAVRREAQRKLAEPGATVTPEDIIRDPYVLEFLDLKNYPSLRESSVEQGIIDNIQSFLLELGRGFSFVARQKRMRFGDEDFYIDLVFYNYILKCFVLIDLKLGKLAHQDIGQMDSYVRMFEEAFRGESDNPTIGLILCSQKNSAIAKYSVLRESKQLFAARYMNFLPSEAELRRELTRERRQLEAASLPVRAALPDSSGENRRIAKSKTRAQTKATTKATNKATTKAKTKGRPGANTRRATGRRA